MRVIITGGAGFIGRAVTRELLRRGHEVRILDSMIEQVHGDRERPEDLPAEAELIRADVRNGDAVMKALQGVDSVVHLAAEVGVGQSMYAVERYTSVNDVGTAVLFEKLIDDPVRRVVTASSMSIYGEGLYRDADAGWSRRRSARSVPARRRAGIRWIPRGGRLRRSQRRNGSAPTSRRARGIAALARDAEVDIVQLNGAALAAEADFPAPVVVVHHSCVATWWAAVHASPLRPTLPGGRRWPAPACAPPPRW